MGTILKAAVLAVVGLAVMLVVVAIAVGDDGDTPPVTAPTASASETEVVTETVIPAPVEEPASASFGDGDYLVGIDIEPGQYRSDGGTFCYWARVRDFSGDLDSYIANDIPGEGSALVQIDPSDYGFSTQGCGNWVKTP